MSINTCRRATFVAAATGLLLAVAPVHAQPGAPSPGGWAIVNADGTLGPNSNVTNVFHVSTGIYRVQFNQDVSNCAANTTIAAHTGHSSVVPGYVVAGRNDNAPTQIRVYTFEAVTLMPVDLKFDLLASC